MNVNLSPQSRALRIAEDNRTHPSILETDGSHDSIVHFDARMVVVVPIAMEFDSGPHEPTHQVEIVRRLTYHHSASLTFPSSTPGIRTVVGRFAPAEHSYNCQHWFTELAGINRFFHSLHWLVP